MVFVGTSKFYGLVKCRQTLDGNVVRLSQRVKSVRNDYPEVNQIMKYFVRDVNNLNPILVSSLKYVRDVWIRREVRPVARIFSRIITKRDFLRPKAPALRSLPQG